MQSEIDSLLLASDASILISDAIVMVYAEIVRTDYVASYFSFDIFIVIVILSQHILDVGSVMICCWLRG